MPWRIRGRIGTRNANPKCARRHDSTDTAGPNTDANGVDATQWSMALGVGPVKHAGPTSLLRSVHPDIANHGSASNTAGDTWKSPKKDSLHPAGLNDRRDVVQ